MINSTLGQALINAALPEELRDYTRVWNKKELNEVMNRLAKEYPDRYREVSHKLMRIGQSAATTGDVSYSLDDFAPAPETRELSAKLRAQIEKILAAKDDDSTKNSKVVELLAGHLDDVTTGTLARGVKSGNRLAEIIHSGSKGSPGQYNTVVGIPLLFTDHKGDPIPVPVLSSGADGLDPVEYFASTYGTRRGVISTKFATQDAGAFAKQLVKANQRLVITEEDCGTDNGISVDGDDAENSGTILLSEAGGLKPGTLLQPNHLKRLKGSKVIVRSPLTCQAENGLCAKCAGIRESGHFQDIGDNIGVTASQALSERLSQGGMNVKHSAGVLTKKKTDGFPDVERLFQMPKHLPGAAAVASVPGEVKSIEKSESGGGYVVIGDQKHYVEDLEDVTVKQGDRVEAGDVLTSGIANPKQIAHYKGIGAARRNFVDEMRRITGDMVSRRNAEVISRGVVSHVRVNNQGVPGAMVGDIVRYDDLVKSYSLRNGSTELPAKRAVGKYLEKPVMHYTIGTKITNSMAKDLKNAGVNSILVNDNEPYFESDVQRVYDHPQRDPDWMVQLAGTNLKRNLLKSVHYGAGTEEHSTSPVPALAKGVDFGKNVLEEGKY